jgi:hypothetical protein
MGMLVGPVVGAKAGLERSTLCDALAGAAKMASANSTLAKTLVLFGMTQPPDGSHDAAAKLPQSENCDRVFRRVLCVEVRPG